MGDERFEKQLRGLGYAVLRIQGASEGGDLGAVRLVEVRAKLDADNRTSVLLILKGVLDGEQQVAFVGGPDFETAVFTLGKKLAGEGLRWRYDPPWDAP